MYFLNKPSRVLGLLSLLIVAGVAIWVITTSSQSKPAQAPSSIATPISASKPIKQFIGSDACINCHQAEAASWKTSDHFHAMEPANAQAVLGDFNNASFTYFGEKTTFSKNQNKFLVKTKDQQGELETFTVKYTLGHDPLQQYLVEFDDGRIQVLPAAWDTRAKDPKHPEKGGQRWFHLYPDENVQHDNPLFWTRPLQNWNHMCGDCHTTNFAKNFSDETNTFSSQWSELANGCESCHGAGSAHTDLMQNKNTQEIIQTPETKNNLLIKTLRTQTEQIDQCGVCHSRRDRLVEPSSNKMVHNEKIMHTWKPALLREGLYFDDGQIQDEVFVTGSFLQSKMYKAGVTCTNCHNPHSGKIKIEGNGLCGQCHSPNKYDNKQHHNVSFELETKNSTLTQCVTCHMPERTYMGVDPRRDHSFVIPHSNHKSTDFGAAMWATRNEQLAASESLQKIINADATNSIHSNPIHKATALMELGRHLNADTLKTLQQALTHNDPLIRLGAVQALTPLPLNHAFIILRDHLNDDSLAVRLAIAPLLASIDLSTANANQLTQKQNQHIKKLFLEYKIWLMENSDRANALVSLASFYLATGDVLKSQGYFEAALKRDPTSIAAHLNYADFYRSMDNDDEAEKLLRQALVIYPDSADAHYALGLLLVRQQNIQPALAKLKQAVTLAPNNSHYIYVYAVGLHSSGDSSKQLKAISLLTNAQQQFPTNQAIQDALQAYVPVK